MFSGASGMAMMQSETKIVNSGIWAIFWVLVVIAFAIGGVGDDLTNAVKANTEACKVQAK